MPRGDGTGPMGKGPATGRGYGNCLSYGLPVFAGAISGFGRSRGFCRGLCFLGSVIAGLAAVLYFSGKDKRKIATEKQRPDMNQ
ncbi:MAG TPA: hypothetical protein DDW90_07925 [Cyanobacteria bacterium UBA9971]|nr:hypothetical protein [Cyanobacteria bacterium UBA9971]